MPKGHQDKIRDGRLSDNVTNCLECHKFTGWNQKLWPNNRRDERLNSLLFREINWRKVDEYRAKGLSWSAVSRVMDIPYNALFAAKARRAEK